MRKGFTLIEMLVVVGIIAALIGASMGGYSFATRHAQQARGREVVSNVATALNTLFMRQNRWPPALAAEAASSAGRLTARAAACLAVNNLMTLSYTTFSQDGESGYALSGLDRCGIVDPWAQEVIKRLPSGDGALSARVPSGGTVQDHILYYALDLDGDGVTEANVGGTMLKIRANVAVWSCGMDGVLSPYPDSGGGEKFKASGSGRRSDDIHSWSAFQIVK